MVQANLNSCTIRLPFLPYMNSGQMGGGGLANETEEGGGGGAGNEPGRMGMRLVLCYMPTHKP